jgi:phage-related protein
MKQVLVAASLMGILATMSTSTTAFAGKEEREMMKNEVMPAVKEAEAKVKSSCGCAMAITVDETTVKSTDDMYKVKHLAGYVTEGAGTYCTDAASKKAVCQMKSLVLAKAAQATFTFKAGKGTATTDGQSACTWEMMTQELDK